MAAPQTMERHRLIRRFTAMGTRAEVQVVGGDESVAARAERRIAALEARWSRFRPGSDVSALNAANGAAVPVAPETLLLLERAKEAAGATDGRYDPTVGGALLAHGYDRTFTEVPAHAATVVPEPVVDGAWPMIEVDRARGIALLPEGTTFDPGGIGKGLAADLVVDELEGEADGILVNLGGDLRVAGAAPDDAGWVISVDDPFDPDGELGRLAIPSGAVATSSRLERRWQTASGEAHHVIDPRTGRPAETEVVAVTVIASAAWWAEVQATSLLLAGPAGLDEVDDRIEAALVLADGTVVTTPALAGIVG